MHISKAIDEMCGGYSVNILTAKSNDDIQEGGSALNEDLFIPFGLYYQNDRAEYSYYKPQKAGTIDNAIFDYLFNAVSKGGAAKPTRKMDIKPVANKKTHRVK